jgi:hypothetical protein
MTRTIFSKENTSPDFICGFNEEYADIGYTRPIQLRNTLGLGNTLGALPVENGGTGCTSVRDITAKLFNSLDESPTFIPSFDSNYENGGYTTPLRLRKIMGLGDTAGALPIANGGTGATTAEAARENLGLGNVPNVATNDQRPTFSRASVLETLASGETLSTSMGKITRCI